MAPCLKSKLSNSNYVSQIESNGALVDEQTYKLNSIRQERQRLANEAALRRLLAQRDEMEASQQAVVTRTMDDIARLEGVLRVKVVRLIPFLTPFFDIFGKN